jgi:hypothetical protein
MPFLQLVLENLAKDDLGEKWHHFRIIFPEIAKNRA